MNRWFSHHSTGASPDLALNPGLLGSKKGEAFSLLTVGDAYFLGKAEISDSWQLGVLREPWNLRFDYSLPLKMAMEIPVFPIKQGDFS